MRPVFIVGTGRCGSTLLSSCLAAHPALLSLSELFVFATDLGGRIPQAFPGGLVDGEAVWRILGAAHPRQTLMLRHDVMMAEALYRPGPGRRFTAETGIPALAATTLPHLTDDPDALLDALEAVIRGLLKAPIGDQYRSVFNWLREWRGASTWVERSGGSLRIIQRLRAHFPEARFVHLVRDGRDCALSMSRHLGFRLALIDAQLTEILGVDPFESADRTYASDLPDELVRYLPEQFDAEAFRADEVPLALAGHYWAGEIMAGLAGLEGLPAGDLLTLRYEDLLAHPRDFLAGFFAFVAPDAPPPDLDALAARVRRPRSDWRALPPATLAQLERACQPGFAALAGIP